MKVFASDYDGTIKVNGSVSTRNLDMISKWTKAGNKFGFVSGRSMESMMQEIEKYKFPYDFIICNNGGIIYNKEGKLVKKYEIAYEIALELIAEIRKMNCAAFVLNNGYHRAKEVVSSAVEDYKYGSYSSQYTVEKILEEKSIAQIIISIHEQEEANKIASYLNEKYKGLICAYPNINCVDIVPDKVSKEAGLAFISDYYNYKNEDIYCMGDAFNDLSMLTKYNAATLHHAFEEVKEVVPLHFYDVASYLEMLMK